MKKYLTLLMVSIISLSSVNAAFAADNKLQEGAKKVGAAIVWPFKKMGEGLKAMGNGMKKMVGKG